MRVAIHITGEMRTMPLVQIDSHRKCGIARIRRKKTVSRLRWRSSVEVTLIAGASAMTGHRNRPGGCVSARGGIRTHTLRRAAVFKTARLYQLGHPGGRAMLGRKVVRQRDFLRRARLRVVPSLEGLAVAADVGLG